MKTQNEKKTNQIIKAVIIVCGLIIAIPFCYGMYIGFKSHTGTTNAITTALENECDCEEVTFDLSTYGLQFSKKEGVSGETTAYNLKNCNFETTAEDFVNEFNLRSVDKIDGYTDIDIIRFQFHQGDNTKVITVKNGIIQ